MTITLLEIISLSIGTIGAITGLVSLVWHIFNIRVRLKLDRAYFNGEFLEDYDGRSRHIKIELALKNLGGRSTTLEDVYITIGNYHQTPNGFKPIKINKHSTEILNYSLDFEENQFKDFLDQGEIKFEVLIIHTFGKIRKSGRAPFDIEHFNLC